MKQLPNIVEARVPKGCQLIVVGDLHGQFLDLMHLFRRWESCFRTGCGWQSWHGDAHVHVHVHVRVHVRVCVRARVRVRMRVHVHMDVYVHGLVRACAKTTWLRRPRPWCTHPLCHCVYGGRLISQFGRMCLHSHISLHAAGLVSHQNPIGIFSMVISSTVVIAVSRLR
jgi:hypothetical protein